MIRIGTIGTGDIVEKIIENIKKTSHLECGAVYSRSREKGEALAKKMGDRQSVYRA